MAIDKLPGENCHVTIGSIDYIGPQVTVWLRAMVILKGSIKYVSTALKVDFPRADIWTKMIIGKKLLIMRYSVDTAVGLGDLILAIHDDPDPAIATTLYAQTWPGVFNFILQAPLTSAWRGASGTFAAHVSELNALFGVNR